MIFDTHAHYDDVAFDEDREELLASLPSHGIGAAVTVGADLASTKRTIELTKQYPFLFGAAGVHPESVEELNEENFTWLEKLIQEKKWIGREGIEANRKLIAVGEIGLDYYWDSSKKDLQKYWFLRQMELAVKEELPVIIHSREAAGDTLDLIRVASDKAKEQQKHLTGVIHCFSYGVEMARNYLNLGFYLGVGGVVTFKNAKKLLQVVKEAPLNRLVLETDCPYLAPVPNRGKRNSSLNLPFIAEKIAQLKKISYEEVIETTRKNGMSLFQIPTQVL